MSKRIVIGITGASGVIYAVRMLHHLKETDCETHLILSEAGGSISKLKPAIAPCRWRTWPIIPMITEI